MFSANENIMLRQHKRRVIEYIESTIPENALDMGTSVMVMQVSCRQPGCVPLETAITIVFPKPPRKRNKKRAATTEGEKDEEVLPSFDQPLIPDLIESQIGGNFKTRILKPLSDVTQEDVLDSLPPNFTGGRKTVESICLKARDMMFAQIGQLVGDDDTTDSKNGKRLVAEYLKACLDEYTERDCQAPEWGSSFTPLDDVTEDGNSQEQQQTDMMTSVGDKVDNMNIDFNNSTTTANKKWAETGNVIYRRPADDEDGE